jgi:hypothetical protein
MNPDYPASTPFKEKYSVLGPKRENAMAVDRKVIVTSTITWRSIAAEAVEDGIIIAPGEYFIANMGSGQGAFVTIEQPPVKLVVA